jgi:hypothetical protein
MPFLKDPDQRKKQQHPTPWWNERHLAVVFVTALLITGFATGWT